MLDFVQTALTYILPFLLVLTLVVTIHELGHFWAARACGVAIDRFAIGFGRALVKWHDKHGVEWRIGWIPLGGYVRFSGDDNAASVPDQDDLDDLRRQIVAHEGAQGVKRYYHFKPVWQRAAIAAAGPAANFLLAIFLFALLLGTVGEVTHPARITTVAPGGAAARAGMAPGDTILSANGQKIRSFEDLERYVIVRANVPIRFEIERAGRVLDLTATPALARDLDPTGAPQEVGRLGIASQVTRAEIQRVRYNPVEAVGVGARKTWEVLDTTVYYLGRLVRGQVSAEQLGGPLRIAQASGAVAQAGAQGAPTVGYMLLGSAVSLLGLAAVLSVSIGFMNLLPIPVLDGGHLLFYAYEAVVRRPVGAKVQAAGYRVGLALLLGFMLFATWNDLQRLRVFQFLGGLFS